MSSKNVDFYSVDDEAHDEQWRYAVDCAKKGDKAGALFIFRRLAKEGCAPALVEVGHIYEVGGGSVHRDLSEAIKWYRRSIEVLNDPLAYLRLGRLYFLRRKSDDDIKRAWDHLHTLFEFNGHAGAAYALGLICERYPAFSTKERSAAYFFRQSSDEGHLLARRKIALMRMKTSFWAGFFDLLNINWLILKAVFKNPRDKRLSIA